MSSHRRQPNPTLSGFLWWLARRTTCAEFEADIKTLAALLDIEEPLVMALDARLQKGLERLVDKHIKSPDFDQPVKAQRELARAMRTIFNIPAHPGGAPSGGGNLGKASRLIHEYADNNPSSWRTLSAPAMAGKIGMKPDVDISSRTMREALKKVRDERKD
jgi:hypothetical protein